MPTVSRVLTDTFQKVSEGECFIQLNGSVAMGFGVTAPLDFHVVDGGTKQSLQDINYNGNYGSVWLKRLDTSSVVAIVSGA